MAELLLVRHGQASFGADDYDKLRKSRERSGQSELATLDVARANGFPFDPSGQAPPPQYPGLHHFGDWPLKDLKASIDWTPFFRAWELAGTYPTILDDAVVGESARSLFADAQAMLDQLIAERWVTPKASVGLWRCKREGDDVLVLAGNDWTRLPFLRQQVKKREGRHNMCLADFINPDGEDWIGAFAVGIHGLEPHLERFKQIVDDYDDILLKALADRLAESFAEVLHAQVRNRLEGMLASNERVLAEFGEALAPDERERIEETLKRSREIAAGDSREALNEAIFDMQGVSKVLTRVMLQRVGRGGAAPAVPPTS